MVADTLAAAFGDRRQPRVCRGGATTAVARFEGGLLGQGMRGASDGQSRVRANVRRSDVARGRMAPSEIRAQDLRGPRRLRAGRNCGVPLALFRMELLIKLSAGKLLSLQHSRWSSIDMNHRVSISYRQKHCGTLLLLCAVALAFTALGLLGSGVWEIIPDFAGFVRSNVCKI